jgi:uncharacterized membrane protein
MKHGVKVYLGRNYILVYVFSICIALSSKFQEAENDDWLALLSHVAFAATALYSYHKERYDLCALNLIVMCTSLVWHSSGKFGPIDNMFTLIVASYAFATTILHPAVVAAPIVLLCVLNGDGESFDQLVVFLPILGAITLYRLVALVPSLNLPHPFSLTFFLSLVFGGLGLASYYGDYWHSMWHVLSALAVALTIEPQEPQEPQEPKAVTVLVGMPVGVQMGMPVKRRVELRI